MAAGFTSLLTVVHVHKGSRLTVLSQKMIHVQPFPHAIIQSEESNKTIDLKGNLKKEKDTIGEKRM